MKRRRFPGCGAMGKTPFSSGPARRPEGGKCGRPGAGKAFSPGFSVRAEGAAPDAGGFFPVFPAPGKAGPPPGRGRFPAGRFGRAVERAVMRPPGAAVQRPGGL